jgi:hypothetical protein
LRRRPALIRSEQDAYARCVEVEIQYGYALTHAGALNRKGRKRRAAAQASLE